MHKKQSGAIHLLTILLVGGLFAIMFMAASAVGHIDRLEVKVAEQQKIIDELHTKVKILEVRAGL